MAMRAAVRAALRGVWTLGQGMVVGLPKASETSDPFVLFAEWFEAAKRAGILLPESMLLASCSPEGRPSARVMLLKDHGRDGFVFYTNYGSRKSAEIDANPHVALVFHWGVLLRQVRIEGTATKVDRATSEAYFDTRDRGSKIGAWASHQSAVLPDRSTLDHRVQEIEERFTDQEVPLPPFWGGYRVVPTRMEFWQGRTSRLHDRILFERSAPDASWQARRLYP